MCAAPSHSFKVRWRAFNVSMYSVMLFMFKSIIQTPYECARMIAWWWWSVNMYPYRHLCCGVCASNRHIDTKTRWRLSIRITLIIVHIYKSRHRRLHLMLEFIARFDRFFSWTFFRSSSTIPFEVNFWVSRLLDRCTKRTSDRCGVRSHGDFTTHRGAIVYFDTYTLVLNCDWRLEVLSRALRTNTLPHSGNTFVKQL